MAVAVVGDFDKAAMEKLIKDHFRSSRTRSQAADMQRILSPITHTASCLPSQQIKNSRGFSSDDFQTRPQAEQTAGDYRRSIIGQVYDGMFDKQLGETAETQPPSFWRRRGRTLAVISEHIRSLLRQRNSMLGTLEYLLSRGLPCETIWLHGDGVRTAEERAVAVDRTDVQERDKTESHLTMPTSKSATSSSRNRFRGLKSSST